MTNEINHKYTDNMVCPWCGYEDIDSAEYMMENDDCLEEIVCDDCEKKFDATMSVIAIYSTTKKEEE